jgi:hypothetical protein
MDTERCFSCGGNRVEETVRPLAVAGREIQDRSMACPDCGSTSYVGEQISEHELAVAEAIRETEGFLGPEDLRALRAGHALEPGDMDRILGNRPGTWARWERGKVVQDRQVDEVCRSLAAEPERVRALLETAGLQSRP